MGFDYTINAALHGGNDWASVTVIGPDGVHHATTDSHQNIGEIIDAARNQDEHIWELLNPTTSFEYLSERVTISNGVVYLDGDPAPQVLSDAIARTYREGGQQPLVNFLEKLANNPSRRSIEQLYPWLEAVGNFTITPEGNLVGYKGVESGGGEYRSVHSGTATVNGVVHHGQIPNNVGDVVEMPRSEVSDDPDVACHTGLHVGTWSYAEMFARGAVLTVIIDPRDVVSVPRDSGARKLRVCRYTIDSVTEAPTNANVFGYESNPDWANRFENTNSTLYGDDTSDEDDWPEWMCRRTDYFDGRWNS